MLRNDGKQYRNLVEQVQYLTDLHDAGKALASWGIRIVGTVETSEELPTNYNGDFGDAYAVGLEAPYDFYIWTRPSIAGDLPYWFPFGQISIVGPQGPQGPKGDKGDTGASTQWYGGFEAPNYNSNYNEGDLYLNFSDGIIYQYHQNLWKPKTNIMGPRGVQGLQGPEGPQGEQGPQGPKGDTGDVGGFINIWGTLQSTDQLPLPSSLGNLTVAYLVEHTGGTDDPNDHYDLYIQVGETSATAQWFNAGPFNAATLVTVNGAGQNVWDADTKLDKFVVENNAGDKVYVARYDGTQTTTFIGARQGYIAKYVDSKTQTSEPPADSTLPVATPKSDYAAANKKYVDDIAANKVEKKSPIGGVTCCYSVGYDGVEGVVRLTQTAATFQSDYVVRLLGNSAGDSLPDYCTGRVLQLDPIRPYQVANKKYVDEKANYYYHPLIMQIENASTFQMEYILELNIVTRQNSSITMEDLMTKNFTAVSSTGIKFVNNQESETRYNDLFKMNYGGADIYYGGWQISTSGKNIRILDSDYTAIE